MKKILFVLSLSLTIISCGNKAGKEDPVQAALREFLVEKYPEFEKISFDAVEAVDSSSFDDELLRREKLFSLRMKQDDALYKKFVQEGKQKNAQLRYDNLVQDIRITNGLDSIRAVMGNNVNDVAFIIYKFSGSAEGGNKTTYFKETLAAVTPDYKVINIAPKQNELFKATGRVIPGYRQLLKGDLSSVEELGLAE